MTVGMEKERREKITDGRRGKREGERLGAQGEGLRGGGGRAGVNNVKVLTGSDLSPPFPPPSPSLLF